MSKQLQPDDVVPFRDGQSIKMVIERILDTGNANCVFWDGKIIEIKHATIHVSAVEKTKP